MTAQFEEQHRARYGFAIPDRRLLIETASVEAVGTAAKAADDLSPKAATGSAVPIDTVEAWMGGDARATPVYDRASLPAGAVVAGTAGICETRSEDRRGGEECAGRVYLGGCRVIKNTQQP